MNSTTTKEMTTGPLLAPACLIGLPAEVARRWRKVARCAFDTGSWDGCVTPDQMVDISQTDDRLILDDPYAVITEKEMFFARIIPILSTVCRSGLADVVELSNRRRWYSSLTRLTVSGADRFWFCLGILGCKNGPLFPSNIATPDEEKAIALKLARMVSVWFPQILALEPRFRAFTSISSNWYRSWGRVATGLCVEAGMEISTARNINYMKNGNDAANAMAEWLAEQPPEQEHPNES